MDYRRYRFSIKEEGQCAGCAVLLTAAIAYLFYDSLWGFILLPAIYMILRKRRRTQELGLVQLRMGKEFLDALRTVSASVLAGMSMENAWLEAERELVSLYGNDSILGKEFAMMNSRVSVNLPLEQQLDELAARSGNADIASFAEVFSFAKRSGGNMITIIDGTANHIRARFETEREIQVLVASKKLEQKIMNAVPLLILAYLKITSVGFLDVLYRDVAGVLFMSGCLLAYGGAILLAERLLKIQL